MTELESNYPTTSATSLKDARNVDLQFISLIKSVTAWLANSSQLLHLTTCDIDFNTTFKSSVVGESRESNPVTLDNNHVNSWNQLKEQLAEIVQTAFVYLADLCVFRLDLIAIPELLHYLTECVQFLSNPHNDNRKISDGSANTCDSVDQRQSNSAKNSVDLDEINDKTQVSSSNHFCSVQQRMHHEMFDSKAADLMLCDMKSVESLYNLAVDLVSLNSRQVQVILENYQLMNDNNNDAIESKTTTIENFNLQQQIPKAWIEFVVSGVKLVADRILTEDDPCHSTVSQKVEEENATKLSSSSKYLELGEPLDLHLPFLLPEDCYPSDNPVPVNNSCRNSSGSESNAKNKNDSIISQDEIDSGICSQSNSINQKHHQLVLLPSNGQVNCNNNNNTTIITVDSIKHFLTPAIQIGWCRLSIRSNNNNNNVYQLDESSMIGTATSYSSNHQPDNDNDELVINQLSSISLARNHSLRPTNHLCSRHCTYSVVVPKIGSSLGLSIVAARSEYGEDLGIYVRGINSESGASQAKLIYDEDYKMNSPYSNNFLLTAPYLQIGDRLIAVNGQPITGLSQDAAVRLVSSTAYEVILTVVRYAKQDVEQKDKITTTADPSKSEESDLQCIDCLLHESLLSNYKDLVKDNSGEDEQSTDKRIIQDSTRRSVNQSGNNDNNNSSGTQLKHPPPTPTTTLHISNSSNNSSSFIPNVHIGMKLSIDTNCSNDTSNNNNNKCRNIHSDYSSRKWNYQSNTVDRNNNSNNNSKISDGFTNLPNDCNLLYRNRSASTNERQLRLYIDASSCNSNTNIYDEPSISEYSLCNESFLSASKPEKSGMRTLSPHNTTNNSSYCEFEQNTLPTRPCHRPKGQSVSFDDRLTASQFTQLHEGMISPIPNDTKSIHHNESMSARLLINSSSSFSPSTITSIQSPNQSFMNTVNSSVSNESTHTNSYLSSVHKSGLNSLENNRLIHSTLGQNTSNCTSSSVSSYHPASKHSDHHQHHHHNISTTSCSSPITTSNKTSKISTVPTLISGSKPPKTFVPTAYVLPVNNNNNINRDAFDGPFLTIKAKTYRDCSNSQGTTSRPSRSMNDLITKSSLDIHQSKTMDVTSNTTNKRTGYFIRRRYTTYTTNRFNVGPRPEPLNRSLVKQNQFT
ncbi:Afadin [Schistosoma japonicum]|nr:Afadin [Schistosoma japonicum]